MLRKTAVNDADACDALKLPFYNLTSGQIQWLTLPDPAALDPESGRWGLAWWTLLELLIYFVYLHALSNWHRKLALSDRRFAGHRAICVCHLSKQQSGSFLSMKKERLKDGCCCFFVVFFLGKTVFRFTRAHFSIEHRHTHTNTLDEWMSKVCSPNRWRPLQFYDLYQAELSCCSKA